MVVTDDQNKNIDTVFADRKRKLTVLKNLRHPAGREGAVEGDMLECPSCKAVLDGGLLRENFFVCDKCGFHFKISYSERFEEVFDTDSSRELFAEVQPYNPIDFPQYGQKLAELGERVGIADACVVMEGSIGGCKTVCAVLESDFLMGSMGTAVGEKITLAAEYACGNGLPLIIFSASGGARMQEGIFSLMQMAKTAAAVKRFSDAGGLFISYLTHPTTGGVTASFASLGDIILAEPGALIGFAGPRVIEQTIKEKLPDGFQRAEFQLEHGFVDAVVPRREMRDMLVKLLRLNLRQVK